MAVQGYPQTPSGFSVPRVEYPFLSELQLLNNHNYTAFIKKYPKYKDYYIMQLEAEGNSAWSSTKKWKQWLDPNKDMPAFRVTANVTPTGAGLEFTATLTPASHTITKLSPVAEGMFFVDDSTNEEFEVTSVNKSTASAHTVTLRNTNSASAVGLTTANSFMKYVGKPSTQEGSYYRDGMYRTFEPIDYDMTIIREDRRYTDSTLFEVLEVEGQSYYNIDKDKLNEDFVFAQELELMLNGRPRTNIGDKAHGNQNTNHKSVLNQALEKGLNLTATTTFSNGYFEDLARQNDADGYTDEYDVLCDIDYHIGWQKFLEGQTNVDYMVTITNGDKSDLQYVFDYSRVARIYGVQYNLKKYDMFSSARTHGADPSKSFLRGTGIYIPKGTMYNPLEGDYTPITRVRHQATSASDSPIKIYSDGGLAGKNTNAELVTSMVTHKGVEVGQAYAMKVGRIRQS